MKTSPEVGTGPIDLNNLEHHRQLGIFTKAFYDVLAELDGSPYDPKNVARTLRESLETQNDATTGSVVKIDPYEQRLLKLATAMQAHTLTSDRDLARQTVDQFFAL